MIRGRVLYALGENLYLSRGAQILRSLDGGKSWLPWVLLPVGFWLRLAMGIPLLARIFRLGVHHLTFAGENAVAVANKESFLIEDDQTTSLGPLNGSRPMSLCEAENTVYYGEYRSNPERSPVHVYVLNFTARAWKPVWCFEGVRHVHGVYHDPYLDALWVTTGDRDSEAGILSTDDNFGSFQKVVGGTQQFRAVQLLFTPEYVHFGSDAPNEVNHLYCMNRSGQYVERLVTVGSSVFYGCKVGQSLFFSTVAEPSRVNTERYAEVWRSDNGRYWYRFLQFKKDFWSMKYFQYGQVFFSAGPGDDKHLYCTPFATKGHGKTFKIDITATEGEFLGDLS